MQKINMILLAILLGNAAYAQETTLKMGYENFDFENSKKKDKGQRYSAALDYKVQNGLYQILYEKTDTTTFKPPLTKDLKVDKYYFKYTHTLDDMQAMSLSYAGINDNIMKEVDGGHIYGIGYTQGAFGVNQYLSDYTHFNVYQTDMKYTVKRAFDKLKIGTTLMGKYIHLEDKKSNAFSQNAKTNYFTPGIKIHGAYDSYHFGAGAFFGKRIFAVMDDGFRIQHHAMEFSETYMFGVGKTFEAFDVNLKYIYQKATEIPIDNENVKVKNILLQLTCRL